jgi:hypothetical protein
VRPATHRDLRVRPPRRTPPVQVVRLSLARLLRKVRFDSMAKKTESASAQPEAPPRPPADPRLKILKKFHGKFLPKGPLRQRHKTIMERWNSGEDHGGVTVEELKALLGDWRATREKPPRLPKA